jgi:hypothetical protein
MATTSLYKIKPAKLVALVFYNFNKRKMNCRPIDILSLYKYAKN